jgi:hypothetical protein
MAESQVLTEAQIAELTFEYRINLNLEVSGFMPVRWAWI